MKWDWRDTDNGVWNYVYSNALYCPSDAYCSVYSDSGGPPTYASSFLFGTEFISYGTPYRFGALCYQPVVAGGGGISSSAANAEREAVDGGVVLNGVGGLDSHQAAQSSDRAKARPNPPGHDAPTVGTGPRDPAVRMEIYKKDSQGQMQRVDVQQVVGAAQGQDPRTK